MFYGFTSTRHPFLFKHGEPWLGLAWPDVWKFFVKWAFGVGSTALFFRNLSFRLNRTPVLFYGMVKLGSAWLSVARRALQKHWFGLSEMTTWRKRFHLARTE